MIVASLLLVIAAAVTLLIGLLNRETIEWVYASIACCLLAGLLLTIGVLRSRPSRKPVLQSGGEGAPASWAGASQWGGAAGESSNAGVLTRDEDDHADVPTAGGSTALGDDEPTRTGMPAAQPEETAGPSPWAPADADTSDVRVVSPPPTADDPAADERAAQPEPVADESAGAEPAAEDVVVVPKPSARGDVSAEEAGAGQPVDAGAAAATPSIDDAERFEQVLKPIPGVGAAKRAALLQHFGTYRKLRAAPPEKLVEVPGISRTLADRIYTALHGK